ncbi:MAG: hypothetical protein MK212_12835 [Saprospiraceae bacterium]|nr:hypothetical protein [Saprospiraceae bacterium]
MNKVFILFLLICCFVNSYGQEAKTAYDEYYAQGEQAITNKEYNQAIELFQKAAKINNELPATYLKLLQCALLKEDLILIKRSLTDLDRLNYDKLNAAVYLAYAKVAYTQKQYGTALQATQVGLQKDPNHSDLLFMGGMVYQRQNKWDEAISKFQLSAKNDPTNVTKWNELAAAYGHQGFKIQSKSTYDKTLSIDPQNKVALIHLGKMSLDEYVENNNRSQDLIVAIRYYEKYITYYPKDQKVLELLKNLYRAQGNMESYEIAQERIANLQKK